MAAPRKNTYWKNRTAHGRPYTFKTAKEFEKAWIAYFDWCEKNPWYRNEVIKSGAKVGKIVKVPTKRPYTKEGFCAFHGLGKNFLTQLREGLEGKEDKKSQDISGILSWAENICYSDKFEGAAVGAYNAAIIAKDLDLVDKHNVKHEGIPEMPAPQVNVYTGAPPLASSEDQIET